MRLFISIFAVLLGGCAIDAAHRTAFVPCYCNAASISSGHVELWVPSGDKRFNAHQLAIQEAHRYVSVKLPRKPAQNDEFSSSEISVFEKVGNSGRKSILVTSGRISFDYPHKRVIVELTSGAESFFANGTYGLVVSDWR
jgi:hypothetical protein